MNSEWRIAPVLVILAVAQPADRHPDARAFRPGAGAARRGHPGRSRGGGARGTRAGGPGRPVPIGLADARIVQAVGRVGRWRAQGRSGQDHSRGGGRHCRDAVGVRAVSSRGSAVTPAFPGARAVRRRAASPATCSSIRRRRSSWWRGWSCRRMRRGATALVRWPPHRSTRRNCRWTPPCARSWRRPRSACIAWRPVPQKRPTPPRAPHSTDNFSPACADCHTRYAAITKPKP